ncbi:MAG: hypothetical protein J1E31_05720 [Helicobacter sp.]|nr:hypothetical protein [Helicobacter sp.]
MKNKILTSLALASLMSLYFVGCSSEPKSVEELKKLSKEELGKIKRSCEEKEISGKFNEDYKKVGMGSNVKAVEENPSNFSKEYVECVRVYGAYREAE